MPIPYQVTLYGCTFKCGHRHVRNLKLMQAHERRCWWSPANRTCKTCKHEDYHTDSAGDVYGDGRYVEPDWYERGCEIGKDVLIDPIYDALHTANPDNPHLYGVQIPPVEGCPFWRQR